MKILIIGSGGREHALAWKVSESPLVKEVICIPGNPGMKETSKIQINQEVKTDNEPLVQFARENDISLTIVGPEVFLEKAIVDKFRENGLDIIGPTRLATQIESSKLFAKKMMNLAQVPTAQYAEFEKAQEAKAFVQSCDWAGIVVKCDGLAAGKGVVVCSSKEEAFKSIDSFLVENSLNLKEKKILLEEKLEGKEVSVFALCDGQSFKIIGEACDYKRLQDGHLGPNTGGMGAYSPANWLTDETREKIKDSIISATLEQMKKQGTPFEGILFCGLMITSTGPKVIEFNARFGDPETQVLLPLIKDDIVPYLKATVKKTLSTLPEIKVEGYGVHIVMASYGYPGTQGIKVRKGDIIKISPLSESQLFFAGVDIKENNYITSGGRVLGITSKATNLDEARQKAYKEIEKINFDGYQIRGDIGL